MTRVLLLRPDRAGDALKSLGVVRSLAQLAHFSVAVLASEHNSLIFEGEPNITVYRSTSDLGGLPAFDVAISLLCDPSEEVETLLSKITSKKKFVSELHHKKWNTYLPLHFPNHTPANRNETHNIALLVSQALGIEMSSLLAASNLPLVTQANREEAVRTLGEKRKGRRVGLCLFASNMNRTYPQSRSEKLVSFIAKDPFFSTAYLFGTLEHATYLEKLSLLAPEKLVALYPSSFLSLGAFFLEMDGVIAIDSGPLHLARSLGVPSLGITSGGDHKRWYADEVAKSVMVHRGILGRHPSLSRIQQRYRNWVQMW